MLRAVQQRPIAAVSFAQPPAGNVALAYVQTVDLQKAAAFEEGFKKHLAWRKAQGDTWRWDTWQMVRGEKLGSYYTVSNGHAWKDFDAQPLGPEANENYMASVGDALLRIDGGMSVAFEQRFCSRRALRPLFCNEKYPEVVHLRPRRIVPLW